MNKLIEPSDKFRERIYIFSSSKHWQRCCELAKEIDDGYNAKFCIQPYPYNKTISISQNFSMQKEVVTCFESQENLYPIWPLSHTLEDELNKAEAEGYKNQVSELKRNIELWHEEYAAFCSEQPKLPNFPKGYYWKRLIRDYLPKSEKGLGLYAIDRGWKKFYEDLLPILKEDSSFDGWCLDADKYTIDKKFKCKKGIRTFPLEVDYYRLSSNQHMNFHVRFDWFGKPCPEGPIKDFFDKWNIFNNHLLREEEWQELCSDIKKLEELTANW